MTRVWGCLPTVYDGISRVKPRAQRSLNSYSHWRSRSEQPCWTSWETAEGEIQALQSHYCGADDNQRLDNCHTQSSCPIPTPTHTNTEPRPTCAPDFTRCATGFMSTLQPLPFPDGGAQLNGATWPFRAGSGRTPPRMCAGAPGSLGPNRGSVNQQYGRAGAQALKSLYGTKWRCPAPLDRRTPQWRTARRPHLASRCSRCARRRSLWTTVR